MKTEQFVKMFVLEETWLKAEYNQKRKITFFVFLCLTIMVLVSLRAVHLYLAQPELSHLILLPVGIVFVSIVSLGVLRLSGRIDVSSQLLLFLMSLMVVIGTYSFNQGTASAVTRWVPTISLAAMLLLGINGGRLWTIFSVLIMLILHVALPPGEGASQLDHLTATAATILVTLITSVIAYFYESMRFENERVLQGKIDSRISFLKTANEQLRTPALILSEISKSLANTALSEDQRSYVEAINKASLSLNDGINRLVDTTKQEISAETTIVVPFLISRLLSEVVGILNAVISARTSEISFKISEDAPRILIGDEEKIRQILYNLIEGYLNQISGSAITIHVGSYQGARLGLLFKVQIKTDIPSRFRIETDATGYRLAIKYIDQLGGSLRTAIEERSLDFSIKIPIRLPSALEEGRLVQSMLPSYQERPPKVLLVDDSPESLLILTKILGDLKFNISHASDGVLAVEKFRDEYFDLVIMDLAMPNLDGFSAIHKMRDLELEELRPPTHIIVISGTDSVDEIKKALLVGANDHLAKPIVKRIIVEKISLLTSENQVSN